MNLKQWATLLVLSVLWGGSFLFVEISVAQLPPLTVVLARVSLSAFALLVILRVFHIKVPINAKILAAFFVMGLCNITIPFSLITWGQTHITSGLASIFNGTMPIFTVLVTHFFTQDEKMDRYKIAGVLVGFAGVAFMIGFDELQSLGNDLFGQLAVLCAAFFYACAVTFGRRFKALGVPPLGVAAGQLTMASIILLPAVIIIDQPWLLPQPDMKVIIALVCLALFSTALAYMIFFKLLASSGATNLSLVTFLIPPIAIFLGWSILGETLETDQFIGMAIIVAGLILIDGRLLGKNSKNQG